MSKKAKPLSMLQSKSNERVKIENEIDNYVRNIEVLVALSKIFDQYNANSTIGKKLTFTNQSGNVTPDLVTEINSFHSGYGILSESKASLPQEQEYWEKEYRQLKNYDRDLEGWSFPVQIHDMIFVTESTLTLKFYEYIQNTARNESYKFVHKLAILDSSREDKNLHFIIIKKFHGDDLTHSELSSQLKYGKRIPLKNMLVEAETIKFYDARPPNLYTMEIMWNFLFGLLTPVEDYSKKTANSTLHLDVNVDTLWQEMKSRFAVPPCGPGIIKRDWIKDALEGFVELKLATRKNEDNDNYEIYFRKQRRKDKETRNFLLNLTFKPKKDKGKNEDKEQTTIDKYYGNGNPVNV